jgi:hypothetical protein
MFKKLLTSLFLYFTTLPKQCKVGLVLPYSDSLATKDRRCFSPLTGKTRTKKKYFQKYKVRK